jgi:hypothetical protein
MSDLAAMQARIAEIQRSEASRHAEREAQAVANRARMRRWSPMFADQIEGLKAAGMFGRVCSFATTEISP